MAGAAAPPASLVRAVRADALRHGFSGTILIGEPSGGEATFTLGEPRLAVAATWRWASITKQLAAVIAMQEVARGDLDLDAPVSRYWPDWKSPNASRIRIRDLLRHNSGLPQPDQSRLDADHIPSFYGRTGTAPRVSANEFCAGRPVAPPPTKFDYNNCDSIVLSAVLERITHRPFEALVTERLAKPLGMKSVGLFAFGKPARAHVQPTGEDVEVDRLINLGVYGASGGAYGTIGDLWRFDHALLSGRLLRKREREMMWKSTKANGFYGFFQWIYPAPLKGCRGNVRIVERQGLIGGIELRNYLLPETGRALILFSRHKPTGLGDPWEGNGFAFDLLSRVACR